METRKTAVETAAAADLYAHVGVKLEEAERIRRKSQTYLQDAARRFRQNRAAVLGMVLLVIIIVMSFVGPLIGGYAYDAVDMAAANQGPSASHWFGTD